MNTTHDHRDRIRLVDIWEGECNVAATGAWNYPQTPVRLWPFLRLGGVLLGILISLGTILYAQTPGEEALQHSLQALTGQMTDDFHIHQNVKIHRQDAPSLWMDQELEGDRPLRIQTPTVILTLNQSSGNMQILNGDGTTRAALCPDLAGILRPSLALNPVWAVCHVWHLAGAFRFEEQATALRFLRQKLVWISDPEQGRAGVLVEELLLDPATFEPTSYRFATRDPEGRSIRHIEVHYLVRAAGEVLVILPPPESGGIVYQYEVRF